MLLLVAGFVVIKTQPYGVVTCVIGTVCIAAAIACKVWGMRLASADEAKSKTESETC